MATKRKTTSDAARLKRARTKLQARLDRAVKSPGIDPFVDFVEAMTPPLRRWTQVDAHDAEQAALRQKVSELAPNAVVSSDQELQAMTICVNALDSIPWLSRRRAVHYLYLRYVTNSDLEPPPNDWGEAKAS